jgi:G6PDH family F420-dependent oxidoreductase
MPQIGYHLSAEELAPEAFVPAAVRAEQLGFDFLTVSDHFHPWTTAQGQSPFVWTVLGGIAHATERIQIGTAVTCPTVRIHPAIIAQAAATTARLAGGRFFLGLGTGEALNEHILGDAWPPAEVRREMLTEAVEIIRELWQGDQVTLHGEHYIVETARIFTLPDEPPPIIVSGFGEEATELAGEIGDGYMNVAPDAELRRLFESSGGEGKPCYGKVDLAFAPTEAEGRRLAYETWPNTGLPGELAQILPTPAHFEQACELVTEEMIAEATPHGPDPAPVVEKFQAFLDAGYDRVVLQQYGAAQDAFLDFAEQELLPALRQL